MHDRSLASAVGRKSRRPVGYGDRRPSAPGSAVPHSVATLCRWTPPIAIGIWPRTIVLAAPAST